LDWTIAIIVLQSREQKRLLPSTRGGGRTKSAVSPSSQDQIMTSGTKRIVDERGGTDAPKWAVVGAVIIPSAGTTPEFREGSQLGLDFSTVRSSRRTAKRECIASGKVQAEERIINIREQRVNTCCIIIGRCLLDYLGAVIA